MLLLSTQKFPVVGRESRFFVCVWNSSGGTAELLAVGEEA